MVKISNLPIYVIKIYDYFYYVQIIIRVFEAVKESNDKGNNQNV